MTIDALHVRVRLPLRSTLLILVGVLGPLAACARSPRPAGVDPDPQRAPAEAAVTAHDISRSPGQPIEALLMSRTPGILVYRTGDGSLAIRIRGSSSLLGNNEPLYVIDGMPVEGMRGGALTGLNPYDIASIRVLKEPAELSQYGSRGANGVILIKMKRPQ